VDRFDLPPGEQTRGVTAGLTWQPETSPMT
jgi:hypothetical protein